MDEIEISIHRVLPQQYGHSAALDVKLRYSGPLTNEQLLHLTKNMSEDITKVLKKGLENGGV